MSEPAATARQRIDAFWIKFLTLVKKQGAWEDTQRWCGITVTVYEMH
jgi:hypothetical protein